MESFSVAGGKHRCAFSLALLLILADAYYVSFANGQQVGVSLKLQGVTIPNNSIVDLDDILYRARIPELFNEDPSNANPELHDQALLCVTDLVDCCDAPRTVRGDWYYPDGSRVRFDTGTQTISFRANRGPNEFLDGRQFYGSVRLYRRYGTAPGRGRFHCEMPSAAAPNVNQTLYVNIVNFGFDHRVNPVTISPSGSSTAGETYSLMCSAILFDPIPLPSNVPSPTLEWYYGPNGNASLPSGVTPMATAVNNNSNSITYTSTLLVSPLSQSHTGMYTCRIGAGILANSATIIVNAPTISVQITTSGAPVLGQNGYSLTCSVNGAGNLNASISYQWIKNNGTQTEIQVKATNVKVHILSFSPFRLSDNGHYTCQATVSSPYLNNDITMMDSQDVTTSAPPINVRATQSSSSAPVEVCWGPPSNGASNITGYRIFYGNGQNVLVLSVMVITSVSLRVNGNYVGQNVSIHSESGQLYSELVNVSVTADDGKQCTGATFRCSTEVGITVGAIIVMECLVVMVITVIVVLCVWSRKKLSSKNEFTVSANMAYDEIIVKSGEMGGGGEYENPDEILGKSGHWTETKAASTPYETIHASNPAAPKYVSTDESVCATSHSNNSLRPASPLHDPKLEV